MSYWKDKGILCAAVLKPRSLTSEEIKKARHLSWTGASVAQIRAALNWNVGLTTATRHLKNYGIIFRAGNKAHLGGRTSCDDDAHSTLDTRRFRA